MQEVTFMESDGNGTYGFMCFCFLLRSLSLMSFSVPLPGCPKTDAQGFFQFSLFHASVVSVHLLRFQLSHKSLNDQFKNCGDGEALKPDTTKRTRGLMY